MVAAWSEGADAVASHSGRGELVSLVALAFALALGAVGCNPHGTCVSGDENSELGAMCVPDYPQKACSTMSGSTFYKEEKAAGLLRCKSLGFEATQGGGPSSLFRVAKKKK